MIYKETVLTVCDNSGINTVKCIGLLKRKCASIGDVITVSIKEKESTEFESKKNTLKKGDVTRAVIVNCKKPIKRSNGTYISFTRNQCVLLDSKGQLLGNRIFSPIPYELKRKGFLKIHSLATTFI